MLRQRRRGPDTPEMTKVRGDYLTRRDVVEAKYARGEITEKQRDRQSRDVETLYDRERIKREHFEDDTDHQDSINTLRVASFEFFNDTRQLWKDGTITGPMFLDAIVTHYIEMIKIWEDWGCITWHPSRREMGEKLAACIPFEDQYRRGEIDLKELCNATCWIEKKVWDDWFGQHGVCIRGGFNPLISDTEWLHANHRDEMDW